MNPCSKGRDALRGTPGAAPDPKEPQENFCPGELAKQQREGPGAWAAEKHPPLPLGTCSDSLLCPYFLGLNLGPFIQLFALAEQWLDVPSVSSTANPFTAWCPSCDTTDTQVPCRVGLSLTTCKENK